jgi:hypothetical protein
LAQVAFPLLLFGFAVLFLVQSAGFPARARLFPQIVLIPLVVLLAWLTARTFLAYRASRRAADGSAEATRDEPERPDWWIALWLLLLPLLMWAIGVIWAVGIFTTAFLLGFDPKRPTVQRLFGSVVAGLVMSAGTQYVFVQWLGMRFHTGLLG